MLTEKDYQFHVHFFRNFFQNYLFVEITDVVTVTEMTDAGATSENKHEADDVTPSNIDEAANIRKMLDIQGLCFVTSPAFVVHHALPSQLLFS